MIKYNFYILFFCWLFCGQLVAQDPYKIVFDNNTNDRKLEVQSNDMEITIDAYDGNEIIINTSGLEPIPERAKGLKSLSKAGVIDNTGLGLDVSKNGNTISIKQATKSDLKCTIQMPRNANILINESFWKGDEITINDMGGEIEIKSKGSDININNVTGPVVAHSTGGDIVVVFSKVSQKGPSSLSSTSGFVDVTMPENTNANLKLNSTSGDIYTDLDIVLDEEKEENKVKKWKLNETAKGVNWESWEGNCGACGTKIKGKLNTGGVDIYIKSIGDDVFLRKAK